MPHIDAQHQGLFRIARQLYDEMSAGRGRDSVERILDRLVQYTEQHFSAEEKLMRQHGYPDLPAHRAEHQALAEKVLKFQSDFAAGRTMLTVQLFRFIRDWLEVHIMKVDKGYVDYIRAKAA